jgi:hypothetical protein
MSIHQAFFGIEKTITFLGSYSTKVSSTTLTLDVPSGVQVGDLLIAVVSAGGGSVGDWIQTSFTWAVEQNNAVPNLAVAYRIATTSEPASYNFTTTNSRNLGGTMLLYRNAIWDKIGTLLIDGNAGSMTATGVTSAKSDSLLFGVWSTPTNGTTISTPTGMTPLVDQSATAPAYEIFTQNISSGATGDKTSTVGGSNASAAVLWNLIPD